MKKYFKQLLFCTFFISGFLLWGNAMAADIHICDTTVCGQSPGDGSTWSNALDDLPTSLIRGNTYWIADGSYSRYVFDDMESGETYIYIKKATADSHGSATGWDNSYGDGQAIFATEIVSANEYEMSVGFQRGYYEFDGVVGSEGDASSYGFAIYGADNTKQQVLLGIPTIGDNAYQLDHITVSHTAIVANSESANCIYSNSNAGAESSNITLSNNYLYNSTSNILMREAQTWIIEYNYFGGNNSDESAHGQQISPGGCDDIVLRGNIFKDSYVFIVGAHAPTNHRWQIYNNIVIDGNLSAGWSNATGEESDNVAQWQVHNNTYVGVNFGVALRGAVWPRLLTDVDTDKSYAYNNLFYDCIGPRLDNNTGTVGGVVHDNNAYIYCTGDYSNADETSPQVHTEEAPNIFTDYAGGVYTINVSDQTAIDHIIDKGKTLSDPYDKDYVENTRPAGSGFDIGAYEYVGTSDVVAPASPSGLTVS